MPNEDVEIDVEFEQIVKNEKDETPKTGSSNLTIDMILVLVLSIFIFIVIKVLKS